MTHSFGFFYTCFNEKEAIDYSIKILRKNYSDSPIYLFSEDLDFGYLEDEYDNLKTSIEEDTLSPLLNMDGDYHLGIYRQEKYQKLIKRSAWAILNRLDIAIKYFNTDYVVMCDPDTLVRGKLTIPNNAKILGSKVNSLPPEFKKFQQVLKSLGSHVHIIDSWGATPAVFEVKTFLKGLNILKSDMSIFDRLSMEYPHVYAHDLLIPIVFSLVGEEEVFNPDIIECFRDPNWRFKPNPLVHQFKDYYQDTDQNIKLERKLSARDIS
tara:strand:+ start:2353 stop:3150 length:798 start_codon:yes stop_codon:yes gene_type:complete